MLRGTNQLGKCTTIMQQPMHAISKMTQQSMLVLCVVFVPLTNAWATEWGLVCLLCAAGTLVIAGALKSAAFQQDARFSYCPIVLAGAACCVVLLQVVPLPASMLEVLSPIQGELFSDWAALGQLSGGALHWSTVSLVPHLTMSCLTLVCCYFLLILGLWYYLQSEADVVWLVRLIAVSSVVMAGVGVMQLLFGNEKYLGVFQNPMRPADWPAKGTFTNQNHFANFLAMGLGCCLYQVFGDRSDGKPPAISKGKRSWANGSQLTQFSMRQTAWIAGMALVLFAGVLSFSRGGIFALFVALGLSCSVFRRRIASLSSILLPAAGFCVIALFAFGVGSLATKWDSLISASSMAEISSGRVSLWKNLLEAAPSYALVGTGAGSHAEVYPLWMKEDFGVRFSHAENGYIQIFLETGLLGLVLLGTIFLLVGHRTVKSLRNSSRRIQSLILVCVAGIVASVLHSLSDFAWYIPACLVIVLSLLMLLFRLTEFAQSVESRPPCVGSQRFISGLTIAFTCVIVFLSMPTVIADARSESHWLRFRGLAIKADESSQNTTNGDDVLNEMIGALEDCLREDPGDCRALADLSVLYLRRFEMIQAHSPNPVSLAEIRDTVKSVDFESRKQMFRWMAAAFPDGFGDLLRSVVSARKSIQGQPLRATSYLAMYQLHFLTSDDVELRKRLISQVLRVRPHDAAVRYAVGVAALEEGRVNSGFEKMKYAFHHDRNLRAMIVSQLMPMISTQEMVKILEPDLTGLFLVFSACLDLDAVDDATWVALKFRAEFGDGVHSKDYGYWLSASQVFGFLNDHDTEAYCLKQSLKARPRAYSTRRRLALLLADYGDSDGAVVALKACLLRNSNDVEVRKRLQEITMGATQFNSKPDSVSR